MNSHIINFLLQARGSLASAVSKKILPFDFSIISEDCWAGALYHQLRIPYRTPTVGLSIQPTDYLYYVSCFQQIHKRKLQFVPSEYSYPVATLSGVKIHFIHYDTKEQAYEKYYRRLKRFNPEKCLTKIDFGKPGYTSIDIEKWNILKIPNSVAFYPPTLKIPAEGVHNGVLVPDWELDGGFMLDITRKHFDLFRWIQCGIINESRLYKAANILLFDPTAPKRIVKTALEIASLKRSACS